MGLYEPKSLVLSNMTVSYRYTGYDELVQFFTHYKDGVTYVQNDDIDKVTRFFNELKLQREADEKL